MSEFGECLTVAKILRVGLGGVYRLMVGADMCKLLLYCLVMSLMMILGSTFLYILKLMV